ncbi:hypothetical protein EVC12_047 [Rhizobium phage RHph_I42]|nr:hypothetical protein EVC12_047 [Rhizobium phage RHph_I42]
MREYFQYWLHSTRDPEERFNFPWLRYGRKVYKRTTTMWAQKFSVQGLKWYSRPVRFKPQGLIDQLANLRFGSPKRPGPYKPSPFHHRSGAYTKRYLPHRRRPIGKM